MKIKPLRTITDSMRLLIFGLTAVLALMLMGVGMFGKAKPVEAWVDPLKTGDRFEFLVIGIAFPLYSVVWLFRKIFLFR